MTWRVAVCITGVAMIVAGCGTTPGVNADVQNVVALNVGGRPVPADVPGVSETASGPEATDARQKVSGVSCKNKMWDPAPSRDAAIRMMKAQAAERGYTAVHSVKVRNAGPDALAMNCWNALVASGVAYIAEPVVPAPPAGT